ncbi:MAG: hypothetical protein U7127_04840 [Phormidium sp.]
MFSHIPKQLIALSTTIQKAIALLSPYPKTSDRHHNPTIDGHLPIAFLTFILRAIALEDSQ